MNNSISSPSIGRRFVLGLRGFGRFFSRPLSRNHTPQASETIPPLRMTTQSANESTSGGRTLNIKRNKSSIGSGVYIDVENLQGEAQDLISSLMFNWPHPTPAPSRMTLYVRADQVELWRLWTVDQFDHVEVLVKGIQHFSRDSSKNSADIAIATNAIADYVRGRITHVVVFSDDSDFISLYASIRDEFDESRGPTPFLWVVTDRHKSLSANVKQFFPRTLLHMVSADVRPIRQSPPPPPLQARAPVPRRPASPSPRRPASPPPPPLAPVQRSDSRVDVPPPLAPVAPLAPAAQGNSWADMAQAIARVLPIGTFRSTDCQHIIQRNWPGHRMSRAGGGTFGTEFKKSIWPELEKMGVKIPNVNRKPITYEMTKEAKSAV